MLAQITFQQFGEWLAYMRMDPFSEQRADYRIAQLACLIANKLRGEKEQVYSLSDFVLKFDDDATPKPTKKQPSWRVGKMIARAIALSQAAILQEQKEKERRRLAKAGKPAKRRAAAETAARSRVKPK